MRLLLFSLAPALLLAAEAPSPAVKEDATALRASCAAGAEQIATLKKGQAVKIRFALAGSDGGSCYSVSVEADGQKLQGYLPANAVERVEQFEQSRRSASAATAGWTPVVTRGEIQAARPPAAEPQKPGKIDFATAAQLNLAADALQSNRPADAEKILAKLTPTREVALLHGFALLAMNRPDQALDILEKAIRENPKDATLLAAAGKASYNLDDQRRALAYWRESIEVQPNPELEQLCRKLEGEMKSDKSTEKSYGMRFLLRYDNAVATPDQARVMVAALEEEFSRISFELGCPADERIVTIVQTADAFHQTTGASEWAGGLYDGKIRIPLAAGKQIDARTRRTFAHEIVHACMSNIAQWPAWLHEGLAQRLSGERLEAGQRDVLKVLARAGKLPKLEDLGNGWARLNRAQASIAYGVSLAAADVFCEQFSAIGPRNLMSNPALLEQITPELDKKLEESLK